MKTVMAANLLSYFLALLGTISLVSCSRGMNVDQLKHNSYEALLMDDLYKRLALLEDGSTLDFRDIPNLDYARDELQEYPDEHLPTVQEAVRDSELIEHSSSAAGNQQLFPAGSALDEALNSGAASKSDDSLPFYCPPPNPCPKGYTSADGCMTDVLDTAEAQKAWITAMQDEGYCTCDREHMFNCPDVQALEGNTVTATKISKKAEPSYLTGEKRQSLVAKKSPRKRRSVKSGNFRLEQELKEMKNTQKKSNPYLTGERLRTVAKKG